MAKYPAMDETSPRWLRTFLVTLIFQKDNLKLEQMQKTPSEITRRKESSVTGDEKSLAWV